VVGGEGATLGFVAFYLPDFDEGDDGVVDFGGEDLVDEGGRHEVVDEVLVVLADGMVRDVLACLDRDDSA